MFVHCLNWQYPAYVFVDHWLQSKHVVSDPSDYKTRMAGAWKESMTAAGVAQSTTFVTFLSAGIGSVMWFRSFGIWAGIAIAVNYLLGMFVILQYESFMVILLKSKVLRSFPVQSSFGSSTSGISRRQCAIG